MQQLEELLNLSEQVPIRVAMEQVHRVPIHWHSRALEVVLALEGALLVRENYETHRIEPGEFTFVNSGRTHSVESCEEAGSVAAFFHIDLNAHGVPQEDIAHIPFRSQLPEGGDISFKRARAAQEFRFLELLCAVLSRHFAAGGQLAPEELAAQARQLLWLAVADFFGLYYIKGRYWYISDYQLRRFNRTVGYIDENYRSKISVSDIMAREYVSRTYFSQFWAKFSSQSFSEFLLMRRLVIAESTLLGTSLSLEEVSKSAGFSAVRYYYKYFEKCYRCKPLEYKARCQAYQKTASHGEPLQQWRAGALLHDFWSRQIVPRKSMHRTLDPKNHLDFYTRAHAQGVQRRDEFHPEVLAVDFTGAKNVLSHQGGGHRLNIDRICELLTLAEATRMTPHISIRYSVLEKRALKEDLFSLLDKLEEIYGAQRLKNWQVVLLCGKLHANAQEGDYARRLRDRLRGNQIYIGLDL